MSALGGGRSSPLYRSGDGHILRRRLFSILRRFAQLGGTMHAFIIEDDYLIAHALEDMLEELGFSSFSFARSEDAAVAGANEQRIDLITADVRLLPVDGVHVVKAICSRRAIQ